MKVVFFAFFCGFSFSLLIMSGIDGNTLGVVVDAFAVLWNGAFLSLALNERAA